MHDTMSADMLNNSVYGQKPGLPNHLFNGLTDASGPI